MVSFWCFGVVLESDRSKAARCSAIGDCLMARSRSWVGSIIPRLRSMTSFSSLAASCSVRDLSVKPLAVARLPLWSKYWM